jgi:chromate transporter
MDQTPEAFWQLQPSANSVRFRDAFWYWLRLGCINFGGPAGQIAMMHQELVVERRWISNQRFLHALNFCMLLPGPEAQQLAIYVGWLLHRTLGGLVAGILFLLPAFFVILALSWIYAVYGNLASVEGLFHGLRAAVVALVVLALLRISSRALVHPLKQVIAASAFLSICFFGVPFPLIILAAALVGLGGARAWAGAFAVERESPGGEAAILADHLPPAEHSRPGLRRAAVVLAVGLASWWGPLAGVMAWRGVRDVLSQEAIFFSKAALVTFGGAYAVLAYIAQAAVDHYGWLEPGEMLDGLGLAESTPGPLILVTEFVGFIGAYRNPAGLEPSLAGILGAVVTVWATFAPCFLWIFLGAPFMEQVRGNQRLNAALSAITAAVVGVVLNLALWFGLYSLFGTVRQKEMAGMVLTIPVLRTLDPFALLLAVVSFVGMWRFRWPLLVVVFASAAAGFLFRMLWA